MGDKVTWLLFVLPFVAALAVILAVRVSAYIWFGEKLKFIERITPASTPNEGEEVNGDDSTSCSKEGGPRTNRSGTR